MIPGAYNFSMRRGSYVKKSLTITDSGTARNLTGRTYRMTIRDQASDAVLATLTTPASGIVITNAAAGQLYFEILATASVLWAATATAAHYDLEEIPSGGEDYAYALLSGTIAIENEQSR